MLPSVLAEQLQKGIGEYIETTFPMTNPIFKGSLQKMLATEDSVFHEPYVAVRLPFRISETSQDLFKTIHQQYKPYVHQQKAFERLTGEDGRSSLIATGTGSGKTECFLYPILEYCYRHRGERGIKALIIYPMNALAADQAKRIAGLIYNSTELHGAVTAGMYVGGHEKSSNRFMSDNQIITDHDTMLSSPPDILLTNYKMLDYLLVRPKDANIWLENKPETLKYIAVDELHTFDGAQGTDLACLLRRLKARLYTPSGFLCCIGTSATMGSRDNAANIREYAKTVFGEPFEDDSVITEDRLSTNEFFNNYEVIDFTLPNSEQISALTDFVNNDIPADYLELAAQSWFDGTFATDEIMSDTARLAIGDRLMRHGFTRSLLGFIGGNYVQSSHVCDELTVSYPELVKLKKPSGALDALFALISHARTGSVGHLRPFSTVQVQVWMRELSRLLAKVTDQDITYALATDLNENQAKQYLPVVNCRDCGETGWVSAINERGNVTLTDLNTFYNLYFKQNPKVTMLFPHDHKNIPPQMGAARLCPKCLQLDIGEHGSKYCSLCGTETFPVIYPMGLSVGSRKKSKQYECPLCGSKTGLSIMGLRSSTSISASISQLFTSKFNDDKKTLAFSDNVQDAAHKAGFFNARTWKFGLRNAIQRFAMAEGNGLSLGDFCSKFIEYWRGNLTDEEFVSLFIAPNMTWMRAYEKMKEDRKLASEKDAKKLITDIEYRLRYEIMLEYGLTSRIGRTLEKSGCSVLAFNNDQIVSVADKVRERVTNELGVLRDEDATVFKRYVMGFLHIMCSKGAFNDTLYNSYTSNEGKPWFLTNDNNKWMPGLFTGRNTPRFVYEMESAKKYIQGFDLVSCSKIVNWIKSCTSEFIMGDDTFKSVAKIILSELANSEILTVMQAPPGYKIYAVDKRKVFVSTDVMQFACDTCGSIISVAVENSDIWSKTPCMNNKCEGHVKADEDSSLGYYGKLYSNGDMVRVIAREHTGLLGRDAREELERDFKHSDSERMPWDANILSCTPTLELGIDIGDLSTVIMCSIPPAQAQFLQRAGRAGRKDGNALTIALANAKPHDLYFYSDPMDMISGTVEPPKVFLRASAVLERQFVAYCMDCWIKRGVEEKAIPKHVGTCLSKLNEKTPNMFPLNMLNYVQENLSVLLRTFIQMFSQYLDEGAISELQTFANGAQSAEGESPMHLKVYEAFEGLQKQRDALKMTIKQLKDLINEIESKPKDSSYDEEIRELKAERTAFINIVRCLNNKDVFNFLSDEGLLPNYAFPEAGIILKAILYRKRGSDSDPTTSVKKRKYEKMVYEYNRSASSAISEFAPSNNFYVDGHKLNIDQVDLVTSQVTKWRLCPNCSHAQIEETGKDTASCPQCGSPAWTDAGQVRTMLKVQMVYSSVDYSKSMIDDESENRNTTFYCKQMLVDVDEDKDIVKAYRMDNEEFAFGYEFVKKATLREINFGEKDIIGEKLKVSGTEEVRKGFKICKHCGKIQTDSGPPVHTYACKAKKQEPGSAEPFEEYLFLYREFVTEALRILVPATTMDISKVRQESFIAAFMLGMKEYFGNVDHLKATLSEVPVADADYRKQYLVIYDSVPGGTGYLKQLMQKENAFVEILEKALAVLENCECKKDPQKDGCYHCLYAYRQSHNIGQVSRNTAITLLKKILSGKGTIEEIPKLGAIPVNSLFDSELERRFIGALDRMGNDKRTLEISKILINSKEGYQLKVGECLWEIEPQVILDSYNGVAVKSKPDFILWPISRSATGQKPVAIFTDGFIYHKDKVADDSLKREAIRRCNKFRVWSLSWKDVQSIFQNQGDYATRTLIPEDMPSGSSVYRPTVENGEAQDIHPDKTGTFELLLQYLENPNAERIFGVHASAYAMSLLDMSCAGNEAAFNEWNSTMQIFTDSISTGDLEFKLNDTLFGKWIPRKNDSHLSIFSGVAKSDIQAHGANASITVCALLNDDMDSRTDKYEAEWNGFWQFYNIMQFLSGFAGLSTDGIDKMVYSQIPIAAEETKVKTAIVSDDAWTDVLEQIFDLSAKEFAEKLIQSDILPPSSVGYELVDINGGVVAECEMAWETEKIVLLLDNQLDARIKFEEMGWTVLQVSDPINVFIFKGAD